MNILLRLNHHFTRPSLTAIPSLTQFIKVNNPLNVAPNEYSSRLPYFIQTYGCQMNDNDSDIVRTLMNQRYREVQQQKDAVLVLINTCSIRQKAQQRIIHRLAQLKKKKVVAVLGCMAERKKQQLFQKGATVVCGPDRYRQLPNLIATAINTQEKAIDVQFDFGENYSGVTPTRKSNLCTSISIMRGCNNMCSFCVVPFVRGRERSKEMKFILDEIYTLERKGTRQITFLGQNVNSYHDKSDLSLEKQHRNSQGFTQLYRLRGGAGARFANLLQSAAKAFPNIRFKFTSPHPKDFPQQLLMVISNNNNIFKSIHLPVQSGSTQMLMKMRRNHTRQSYISLVQRIRSIIPNVTLSTDIIVGFCGETQSQFQETLSLMREVKYDMAYMFAYSVREATHAYHTMTDDVPEEVKQRRLRTLIDLFVSEQAQLNAKEIGKVHLVLIEKMNQSNEWRGLSENGKKTYISNALSVLSNGKSVRVGDYVAVKIRSVGARFLKGQPIAIVENIQQFYRCKHQMQ